MLRAERHLSGTKMLLAAALMSVVALVSVGPGLSSHRADSSSPSSWRTRPRRLPGGQRQQQQPQQPSPTTGVVLATDFGAVGDGAHDDTAGLQAAIEHARNRSTLLRFPGGKYRITSYLDCASCSCCFCSDHAHHTRR
eukprot:COSAG01_NODE_8525_length_2753_cov_3.025245_3_plen_138_part_00